MADTGFVIQDELASVEAKLTSFHEWKETVYKRRI